MILCRCGYEAEDADDLARHITSWLNYFHLGQQYDRDLEHVEA